MGMSFVCYQIANLIYPLRCSEKSESMGLDMSQHKETIIVDTDDELVKPSGEDLDSSNRIELGSM
jgi:hypothetical protein